MNSILKRTGSTVLLFTSVLLFSCSDDEDPKSGGMDAGVSADVGFANTRDGGTNVTETCDNPPLQAPAEGTCKVTAGNENVLIRSTIITPEGKLENGHLLVGANGKIACAACDCSGEAAFAGATVVECADGVVSPGLINGHEHLNFAEGPPKAHPEERFDHRHDWRRGKNGHNRIPSPRNEGGSLGILWGELRHLLGGATTINGSGGAEGLLRNIDLNDPRQEGLGLNSVEYSTFPLGDASGATRTNDCNYASIDAPTETGIRDSVAYTPHISEGINIDARNEFLCLSRTANGGEDVILPKTGIIHAVGITPADVQSIAADQASVIWSPRTNIDLYGHTAQVTLMARNGVRLALGTDWVVSGSMNMLRELQCVDNLNRNNYGSYFDDREIIDMATKNGADALGAGSQIGRLAAGYEADIAIFNRRARDPYRAIIEAQSADVVMVMRGGKPLYGDASIIDGVLGTATGCEALDVCSTSKKLCLQRDAGYDTQALRAAIMSNPYEPFYCGEPPLEPSCIPYRSGEFMGIPSAMDSDGDGIINDLDLCPNVFSAIRPLDNDMQADADQDMVGDVCDPCPLDAFSTDCTGPNPDDRDGDGILNDADNCPDISNEDQADRDEDMKGDVCDPCPDQANPGAEACVFTVYDIKQGLQMGQVKIADVVVTASGPNGYFVQMPSDHPAYDASLGAKFSGLFIFTNVAENPAIGDKLDIQGETTVFYGQTQLQNPTHTVKAQGAMLPSPIVETAANLGTDGALATEYEGVLVEVQNVSVTAINPEPGAGDMAPTNSYVVDSALRVNDYMYLTDPFPQVGEAIAFVRGILRHSNSHSKLEPRSLDDVGLDAALKGFTPSTVYVPTASSGIPAGGFVIELTRATETQVSITLVSSSTSVTVPSTLNIDAGQASVDVPVTIGMPTRAEEVTITASYDGKTVSAVIYPYQDSYTRFASSIAMSDVSLRPGETAAGQITLNLPAQSMGTTISLSVSPSNLGTVMSSSTAMGMTSSVSVVADQLVGAFSFVASSTTGVGMLLAHDETGTVTASISFEVTTSVTRTPGPGDLIITEVYRNPAGNQPEKVREWFEVHNPTTDSIILDGLNIADNGGPGRSHTIEMTQSVVAPGGYAIIAYSSDMTENGGLMAAASYGADDLQLSNSGDQIALTYGADTIDEIAWTGSWPGGGNGVAMCLKFPYADNSMSSSWADSVGTFGTNQGTGHPGIGSDSTNCP